MRGYMFQLTTTAEDLGFSADDFYEHVQELHAESLTDLGRDEADARISALIARLNGYGAKTGRDENNISYLIFTPECKRRYFENRLQKVKKMAEEMSLEAFSEDTLAVWDLRQEIDRTYGDAVCDECTGWTSLNNFIRKAEPGVKYYIAKDVVLMR